MPVGSTFGAGGSRTGPVQGGEEAPTTAASGLTISDVRAIPLGHGNRALVVWDTDLPGTSRVQYGLSPTDLNLESGFLLRGGFDRRVPAMVDEHSVFINNLLPGNTYHFRVGTATEDDLTAVTWSPVSSFVARNGPDSWDGQTYTVNMWVKTDWGMSSAEFNTWSTALRTFALLAYDMTDGYLKIGTVILEDSDILEPNAYEGCTNCLTGADVSIATLAPFDSHTVLGGIESTTPIVLGRFGQLVTTWRGADHRAWVLAHEFGHWALWLPDQYTPVASPCVNVAYDVSVMHNTNVRTEMDRSGTPCAWQSANGGKNSWDDFFRVHYPQVPSIATPDVGPCFAGACSGSPPAPFELLRRDR